MFHVELRKREIELQHQAKENAKLLANALAAKEASRMKSQFLANVSYVHYQSTVDAYTFLKIHTKSGHR